MTPVLRGVSKAVFAFGTTNIGVFFLGCFARKVDGGFLVLVPLKGHL